MPNFGILDIRNRVGKGRYLEIPKVSEKSKKIWEESFLVEGPLLFNSMPAVIRNYDGSKEGFKKLIDEFFTHIPDELVYNGNENVCKRANGFISNSIRDWIKAIQSNMDRSWWRMEAEYDGLP